MRRALRWAFCGATILLTLTFAAICLLWVRSYRVWEDLYVFIPPSYTAWRALPYLSDARSSAGGLALGILRPRGPVPVDEMRRITADFPSWTLERVQWKPIYPLAVGPSGTVSSPACTQAIGISWATYPSTTEFVTYDAFRVAFPYWMPALGSAVAPATWTGIWSIRRWRKKGRRSVGLCPSCGYDIRATPQRCPECGSVTSDPQSTGKGG